MNPAFALEKVQGACGCHIVSKHGCDGTPLLAVKHCALHGAAAELLTACEETLIDLRVARLMSEKGLNDTIKRLEAAIRKAGAQ